MGELFSWSDVHYVFDDFLILNACKLVVSVLVDNNIFNSFQNDYRILAKRMHKFAQLRLRSALALVQSDRKSVKRVTSDLLISHDGPLSFFFLTSPVIGCLLDAFLKVQNSLILQ